MNNTDRRQLERIHNCMQIPGCNFGGASQSATFHGVANYAKDIYHMLPRARKLLYIIGTGDEFYTGEWEELMTELEAWFNKRVKEGWE